MLNHASAKQLMNTSLKTVLAIVVLLFTAGCGILKGGNRKNTSKITGTMLIEQPVCDKGTKEKPASGALANTTWYIKHGKTNHADSIAFDQFSTDDEGRFTLRLEPGDYAIVHKDKLMNFGEFRLKYSSDKSTYIKVRDEDCFRRWYNSADFLLHVSGDTTVQFLVKSRCFTLTNPCIEYTGPK
jgi:hypothetical protein